MPLLCVALGACSRGGGAGDASDGGVEVASTQEVVDRVRAAARALGERNPTVDYVADQMEGVIKGRTPSQALILYNGYRATFTTPGDRVTRIRFDFVEAKPAMSELTSAFGTPEELPRGWLYHHTVPATGAAIRILAEPVSKPATEGTAVRLVLVEGDNFR